MQFDSFSRVSLQLACVVGMFRCVGLADDVPSGKASTPNFEGKKVGQVRDDNSLKLRLIWIPPGKFTMGSPANETGHRDDETQVEVRLTKGFWLGKYEVTQAEWRRLMQTAPWSGKDNVEEGDNYPVVFVTLHDAVRFCDKLTKTEHDAGRLSSDWKYTLPTEAQWEYACRAGTTTRFSFGDDQSVLAQHAWFIKNGGQRTAGHAHEVGQKKPNPWGLYDMHGNVAEWCGDVYAKQLPGGDDPEFSAGSPFQLHRGGSWRDSPRNCRSADRSRHAPDDLRNSLGFRLAAIPSGK